MDQISYSAIRVKDNYCINTIGPKPITKYCEVYTNCSYYWQNSEWIDPNPEVCSA